MIVFDPIQRRMTGHAALILFVAMCAGIGLLVSAVGGIELIPGNIVALDVPGNTAGWVRAHIGGILNALLLFVIALIVPGLEFSRPAANLIGKIMTGTAWANTLFYWAALFAPNRALTFGSNRFGNANLASWLGLAPALLFTVVSMITVAAIARQAFKK